MKPLKEKLKRTYQLNQYQLEALKILSTKTRIKQVDYVREAIDGLLLKYHEKLPEHLTKYIQDSP